MNFEFTSAGRIIFGSGSLKKVGALAAGFGCRAFLVAGYQGPGVGLIDDELKAQSVNTTIFTITAEPDLETVAAAAENARSWHSEMVIALGGGSAIDTGKAIAALITNGGELIDYLEVIGKGKPLLAPSLPFIAVPTTAGTGSEVTSNAVIESREHKVKVSLRHTFMIPRIALIDPELTLSLPPEITASSGLDALTQVIEPFVSIKANAMTDALCRDGIYHGGRNLARAYDNGDDLEAREAMALVSLFGGMALANAKLGAVHGFAGPLGGMVRAGHGILCATLLPHVMEANIRALRARGGDSEALRRFDEIARLLTDRHDAGADEGVAWLSDLCRHMLIPPLSASGVSREDFPTIIEKAQAASSMQGNPIKLAPSELEDILNKAF
jgi:alcohol dehydrogenase class IV